MSTRFRKNNSRRPRRNTRRRRTPLSRALTNMSRVQSFRLVDNASSPTQLSSTSGGVLAGYQNADPSGGSGSTWTAQEWTNITALYSQVRLVEFKVSLIPVPQFDTKLAGDISNYLTISSVLSSIAVAPTSSHAVYDNADAKIYTPFAMTTGKPIVHTLRPRGRPQWAVVTTPSPGSYAGCPGAIQWYADQLPVSAVIFMILIEGIYEFRSRI